MTKLVKLVVVGAIAAHALMLIGCGGKTMGRYNIELALDPALAAQAVPPSITVNIVAPPSAEEGRWRSADMGEYWNTGNQFRVDSMATGKVKEFEFGPGNVAPKKLSASDPVWEQWSGSEYIFVLARLSSPTGSGESDTRRLVLERDTKYWSGETIKIRLQRGVMSLDTPKTPPPPPKG